MKFLSLCGVIIYYLWLRTQSILESIADIILAEISAIWPPSMHTTFKTQIDIYFPPNSPHNKALAKTADDFPSRLEFVKYCRQQLIQEHPIKKRCNVRINGPVGLYFWFWSKLQKNINFHRLHRYLNWRVGLKVNFAIFDVITNRAQIPVKVDFPKMTVNGHSLCSGDFALYLTENTPRQ